MRKLKIISIALLLAHLLPKALYGESEKSILYLIEVKSEISASSAKKISKGLAEALELEVDGVILHLNTYGGAVDAADSIRTSLIEYPLPTAVFIDNQAVSAGALISIACDSIYMKRGGTIGAATVVDATGKPMPDKYQSFMRAMMRSTAEAKGRDPLIAEKMVMIDSTKVLSLTAEEAVEEGFCEGVLNSVSEVALHFTGGVNFTIKKQHLTPVDRILLFFLSPLIQGILLMMIMGGIYFELKTPGIGLPSAIAIMAALLYFLPLYIEGIAQYWEIGLFIVGVILILVEIFVLPGFGITGIAGIILALTGLTFAMIDNDLFYYNGTLNFSIAIKPVSIVITSTFLAIIGSITLAGHLFKSNALPMISLDTSLKGEEGFLSFDNKLSSLIGEEGRVESAMRPSGKVEIGGKWYEATLIMGSAVTGDRVKVVKVEGGRLYCELL